MADISRFLQAILDAVYGEEVRGSIHDAIEIINDVSEVVLTVGTAVTSTTSSSTGFFPDTSLYLNINTCDLWKCIGEDSWNLEGNIRGNGIHDITKTSESGLVDTYTITYDDGTTETYQITNGADGNRWYYGTTISGGAVLPTVYPSSGIAKANANDAFLNKDEGYVYICVTGGDANTATWAYYLALSGSGAATLEDLTDVDVNLSTLANKDILEFDSTTNKWKNVSDRSFVRYAGSISFNDLMSGALSTYLTAAYEDMFFTLTSDGTLDATTAAYWTGSYSAGDYIPEDSHIAVINIAPAGSTPTYRFDDFGGYVDISGKADKTEIVQFVDATLPSGQLSYNISNAIFKTTSRIVAVLTEGGVPYQDINIAANGTCTITFPSALTSSLPVSIGISNATSA